MAKKSVVEDLRRAGVEVIRDKVPGIAHNIVTITGSYNFTEAASKRNAKNVIAIQDKKIVREYLDNWIRREEISR